jgi:hypothetical protein
LREHYLWLAEMWHELAEARATFLKLNEPQSQLPAVPTKSHVP